MILEKITFEMIQIVIDMIKRLLFVGFNLSSCFIRSQSKISQNLKK